MNSKEFFDRLKQLKEGDAAYLTIESKADGIYCNGEKLEE